MVLPNHARDTGERAPAAAGAADDAEDSYPWARNRDGTISVEAPDRRTGGEPAMAEDANNAASRAALRTR